MLTWYACATLGAVIVTGVLIVLAGLWRPVLRGIAAIPQAISGAMLAGLVLIPVLNLLTPLFGVALMVHVHKALTRRALPDRRPGSPPRLEV